ncbi:MAG: hypothetical protein AAGA48_22665 [Myxococcota bacterium]
MSMKTTTIPFLWAALALAPGCAFDEGLIIENLRGTVSIPVEAVTRTIQVDEGEFVEIEADPRLIGPVYLGLYSKVEEANVIEEYPHPEFGPQFQPGRTGDAFPYGGTTIGDLRFACLPSLSCRLTSGRFETWDSIVEWFELLETPLTDVNGAPVPNGEYLRQVCYDFLNITSDEEIRVTAFEDRNNDGYINSGDLDFQREDDFFVAEFTMFQQELFYDQDDPNCTPGRDCTGFSLWGWMDAPDVDRFDYTTCFDDQFGLQIQEYNIEFEPGASPPDVLNFPSRYIARGDWVSTQPFIWSDVFDEPNLVLDFEVQ